MRISSTATKSLLLQLVSISFVLLAGCASNSYQQSSGLSLTGAQEVPPVTTSASGSGTITVGADKSVSGSVTTSGIAATAAHIHEAAMGVNGPVIVPLTKTSDNVWSVAPGAKLTDAQYDSYKAGKLYVNVHSAANKGGEIRAQLKP
jgi:CHRD domain